MICLASYNIWNSNQGMPYRGKCILEEIKIVNPDILCMQEIANIDMANTIANELHMNYFFSRFPGEDEGIGIFSKYPITEKSCWIEAANAQYSHIEIDSKSLGIVNLHLPCDSVLSREKSITSVIEKLKEKKSDYMFMLGDFNCGDNSDVIRMIVGDCSIQGVEANPCFFDLALASAQINGTYVKDTLNFRENPRFFSNTIEVNQRFDRIFLKGTYPCELPRLIRSDIFGTKVYSEIGLAASDHFGVYAELEI